MKRIVCILLTICLLAALAVTAGALDQIMQINDFANLLSYEQWTELNAEALNVTQMHQCGIHVMTVDRWQDYGGTDVLDCARKLYDSYSMGSGAGRDGLLLFLSMDVRDYALLPLGSYANAVFDDYALMQLEDEFLDDLGNDDWAGAFSDYIRACDSLLSGSYDTPADTYPDGDTESSPLGKLTLVFLIPCIIALIVCLILKSQMRSVRKQTADAYISPEGLDLRIREDRFLYNTVTRRRIETSSSGSGRSRSGGRSGKF